jgi:hypothetical protein
MSRAIRAALLAYPPDVRERLGAEMTATLLDVSRGSRRRYARELAGLTRAGMGERGRRAAAEGARRVLADGVCLAAVWLMTLDSSTLLAQTVRGLQDPLLAPASLVGLGVALALALVGYDRPAGAAALLWTAARLPALAADTGGSALSVLAVTVVPAACFTTLLLAPRRSRPGPRGLVWLAVPAGLALTLGPPPWEQSPLLVAFVGIVALLVVVSALAQLPADPRLAIAGAIPLLTLGVRPDRVGVPLVVAAVVLAAAAARLWRLRRVPI